MLAEHLSGFAGPRILITHDPAEAALLAERVVVVEAGTVTQTGTPEQILRAPRTAYTADLAGLNLLTGVAGGGMIDVGSGPGLQVADRSVAGEVLLTIHPRAVSIHPSRPTGSPRNTWPSTITSIETLGSLCRVQFGDPIPLTAEITVAAQRSLGLEPGSRVWVAIKATEIEVLPGSVAQPRPLPYLASSSQVLRIARAGPVNCSAWPSISATRATGTHAGSAVSPASGRGSPSAMQAKARWSAG
jgi:molybdate transport system ATP-binding protein